MERPSLRRQLVMIFLGIAIPIGILLGLLLFFSGLYSRNRLAAAASGGLDMFTTNFENQLDSVENYLLNLSLNDATFRSLSEQTDRTSAYLDAYEIAQGFPAVLAANDLQTVSVSCAHSQPFFRPGPETASCSSMAEGKSHGISSCPPQTFTARSMAFSSSRTLPGHGYRESRSRASALMACTRLPSAAENLCRKWFARSSTSPRHRTPQRGGVCARA